MQRPTIFENYDDEKVYARSEVKMLSEDTRNFVVEFGKDKADIAFNIGDDEMGALLESPRPEGLPVRWINIWAPNLQTNLVQKIGEYYKFSHRLRGIIGTEPQRRQSTEEHSEQRHRDRIKAKLFPKDDIEMANGTSVTSDRPKLVGKGTEPSHYSIANQMIHYNSVDVGDRYLCIGANWMHDLPSSVKKDSLSGIDKGRRLWSWLVLCDDDTVLSLHESPGVGISEERLEAMRGNTLSVLGQLSNCGHSKADPISLQPVRQALDLDESQTDPGHEGASNLFYYLFDDWRTTYASIAAYSEKLDELNSAILGDVAKKAHKTPSIEIIPQLHVIGRDMRVMQHLYESYKKIIQRILEVNGGNSITLGSATPGTVFERKGVMISRSACNRFERLGDRIQLLVLSELQEFLAEKDALVSTYFNINAQKDSEATARLTRSATLLAKLSVLFLPVSLMTSYFSTQIEELQGTYTVTSYWVSFAVVMSLSFLILFLLSRPLLKAFETLELRTKHFGKYIVQKIRR